MIIDESEQLRRNSRWAFLLAAVCSFGAVAFGLQYVDTGTVHLSREGVTLTGRGALSVPGAALLGATGFLVFGVRFRRRSKLLQAGKAAA